jgi:hypothetical protein
VRSSATTNELVGRFGGFLRWEIVGHESMERTTANLLADLVGFVLLDWVVDELFVGFYLGCKCVPSGLFLGGFGLELFFHAL